MKSVTLSFMAAGALMLPAAGNLAQASLAKPGAYQSLTAVELAPARAPRLQAGLGSLQGTEQRYSESLPLQLEGAIKRVSQQKYESSRSKPRY